MSMNTVTDTSTVQILIDNVDYREYEMNSYELSHSRVSICEDNKTMHYIHSQTYSIYTQEQNGIILYFDIDADENFNRNIVIKINNGEISVASVKDSLEVLNVENRLRIDIAENIGALLERYNYADDKHTVYSIQGAFW